MIAIKDENDPALKKYQKDLNSMVLMITCLPMILLTGMTVGTTISFLSYYITH